MKKFSKVITLILLMALSVTSLSALAAPTTEPDIPPLVIPHYDFTSTVTTGLMIDDNGEATIYGSVIGYPDLADRVRMYVYLEKYKDGVWQNVKCFSEDVDDFRLSISEYYPVQAGYKYRVYASIYVYNGSQMEYITDTSNIEIYNP